jgi:predicted ABC-type exoprotein transport system permease subunit
MILMILLAFLSNEYFKWIKRINLTNLVHNIQNIVIHTVPQKKEK